MARKLIERTWTVLARGEPYQLRDVDGTPVTAVAGRALARTVYAVPEDVRARARARSAATHRAKLTK